MSKRGKPSTSVPLLELPPVLYHLAEAANWPSIQRHGLLCAAELIVRSHADGVTARQWRTEHTMLPNGVEIRDQKPMPPAALARALVGMKPDEWYALINRHVFFWIDPERLNGQRAACAPRPQVVLTLSTERLLACHAAQAALSPLNSGYARRSPAKRNAASSFLMNSGGATAGPARPPRSAPNRARAVIPPPNSSSPTRCLKWLR